MPIRFVLFDHDGTLMSTLNVRARALEHAMQTVMGRAVDGEDIFARTQGQSLAQLGDYLTDGDDEKSRVLIDVYRDYYYAADPASFVAYDGIPETLKGLHAANVRLAVVTSKLHRGARDELAGCGLIDYFDHVVGSDDVTHHKPNPEPLNKAMAAIGADPASTLMVGDTTADMFGAKAAGTLSAAALWDSQGASELRASNPDFLLHDPREILPLLNGPS